MNANPSLFGSAIASAESPVVTGTKTTLADLLYDGFYMVFLLKNAKTPTSAQTFSERITEFLSEFERHAKRHGFSPEDIFDAKYAFCATVDEAILSSRLAVREDWERRPLQLTLFGDQLAGEYFFDKLEGARNHGGRRVQTLEVFHMCLLLGFRGKYMLEGPERLTYLTAQLGEQIAHIKGRRASFAPHWARPDSVSHALRRGLPLWAGVSVLALCGLAAFVGIRTYSATQTHESLEPYRDIVMLAPKVPHITITLP